MSWRHSGELSGNRLSEMLIKFPTMRCERSSFSTRHQQTANNYFTIANSSNSVWLRFTFDRIESDSLSKASPNLIRVHSFLSVANQTSNILWYNYIVKENLAIRLVFWTNFSGFSKICDKTLYSVLYTLFKHIRISRPIEKIFVLISASVLSHIRFMSHVNFGIINEFENVI